MRRTRGRIGVGFVLVSTLVGACLAERENDDVAAEAVARPEAAFRDDRAASDVVLAVRMQLERGFGKTSIQIPGARTPHVGVGHFDVVGSRAVADTEMLSLNGLPMEMPEARAEVVLPSRADGAFRLRDERSGLSIDVGLVGATASAREESSGYIVYRSGYGNGAHIVHRPTLAGTEDYVFFPETLPETPELRYDVALGEGVAGLRLVSKTLEMLDADGTPRLRMAPPYAVDGDGRRLAVEVAIEGCAYDVSGVMPWGRPTVDPGAKHCTVHLSWSADAKAPLVVDPQWILTTNMNKARLNAPAVRLGDGRVFVQGGDLGEGTQAIDDPEIYDPANNTWATTVASGKYRTGHAAVLTPLGVLLISGKTSPSVHLYNPANSGWSFMATLPNSLARVKHTATFIPGKGTLVVGGIDVSSSTLLNTAIWLGTAPNAVWDGAGTMAFKRAGHTATLLKNDTVLIVGGFGGDGVASPNSAEMFDAMAMPPNSPWTIAGTFAAAHANHAAARLGDGRVVVMGGIVPLGEPSPHVDIYDPATKQWSAGPSMAQGRAFFPAVMPQGMNTVVVLGGMIQGANNTLEPTNTVELFLSGTNEWKPGPEMSTPRAYFPAEALGNGRIIAIGGSTTPATGTSELLACASDDDCSENTYCAADQSCKPRQANGTLCGSAPGSTQDCFTTECRFCASNLCVDGFCCDTACDGQCETCNGAGLGGKPGQCMPMTGPPVTDTLTQRVACNGEGLCGGSCNGVTRDACTYPQGNTCSTGCKDGKFQSKTCDGFGKCEAIAFEQTCAPYMCDDKEQQCTTTCTPPTNPGDKTGCDDKISVCNVDHQCIPRPTKCDAEENSMVLPDGLKVPCEAFRCDQGACLTVCNTAYDCAQHPDPQKSYVCDESRMCVEKNFEDTVEIVTSCSASQSPNSSRLGWLAALAMAGAFAARRHRPRA